MARNRSERSPSRRVDSGHADTTPRDPFSPSRRVHFDHTSPQPRPDAAHPLENRPILGHHEIPVEKPDMSDVSPEELSDDTRLAERLNLLHARIRGLAESEFNFNIKGAIIPAFVDAPPELVTFVGRIALGGPNGPEGWRELIEQVNLRKALVFGLVSRVLHEHIFASLCFGSTSPLIKELKEMEKGQVDKDGFHRSEARAKRIVTSDRTAQSDGLPIATARVTLQLQSLLKPIRDLNLKPKCSKADAAYTRDLYVIVNDAAYLGFKIRSTPDVIYHFAPVFKDEEFEPKRMHCENLRDMQKTCPMENVDADGRKISAPEPRGDPSDVALVRIVCSLGCVAYRKGGGDLAKKLLAYEEGRVDPSIPPEMRSRDMKRKFYGREIKAEDGFRSRTLTKANVALRWGKPQFEDVQFAKDYMELAEVRDEVLLMKEKKPAGCRMM